MSQLEVDKVIPQSGTTLTIGDSGDTITIASGATLSGDLNASNLTSGTVPDARITGAYTNLTSLTITTADNSHALELISTDADASVGPRLSLYRNSASPADGDILGDIRFMAEDDAGDKLEFAKIDAKALDVSSGSRDTQLKFQIRHSNSGNDILTLTPTEVVFNDGSFDTDFRVESNANANMLFVDANNNRVGIGTSAPTVPLMVQSNETQPLLLKGANDKQMVVETTGGSTQITSYQLKNSAYSWQIENGRSANTFTIRSSGGGERVRIDASGNFGIATSDPKEKLDSRGSAVFSGDHATATNAYGTAHGILLSSTSNLGKITAVSNGSNDVKLELRGLDGGTANSNQLVLDGGTSRVGIGDSAPQGKLHVKTSDSGVSSSPSHSNELVLENSTNGGITFNCGASNSATMTFQNSTNADDGSITYRNSEREFRFKTAGADRMRFHANGVISSTGGIALGVGTANTASNVLSDYEEGTFTPVFNSGVSGSGYTHQVGRYTKIGNKVFIEIQLDGNGLGTNGDHLKIGSLPFTSIASAPYGAMSIGYNAGFVSDGNLTILKGSSDSELQFYQRDGSTLTGNETSNINQALLISGQYTVA